MEIKEVEKQIETKFAELKKQVEEKTSGGVKLEDFQALETKYNEFVKEVSEAKEKGVKAETIDAMQKHLDALDIKLQKKGTSMEHKSFNQALKEQLEEKAEDLKALNSNRSASVNMELKQGDMMLDGNWTGTRAITDLDTNIGREGVCPLSFRNIVNVGTTTGNRIVYIDKSIVAGGADTTAEGQPKSKVEYEYIETEAAVRKITAYVKVSKEMLADVSFIRSEINTDLRREIDKKLNEQIASGDGIAPNLKGILEYAPTIDLAGSPYAAAVDTPGTLDVIRVAIAMIQGECFTADYIVLNPADAALLELAKGTDGHYMLPPFGSTDGLTVSGVRVITDNDIDVGDFLVGDFSKANLRIREAININVGYENDDFTKNMVTILAEMRAAFYVKTQHQPAFLQGTFATVQDAIEAGV